MYQDVRKLDFKPIGMAIKKLVERKVGHRNTLLDISVDQFFYPCDEAEESNRRKQIDVLLNGMNEQELIVVKATTHGLKIARETTE